MSFSLLNVHRLRKLIYLLICIFSINNGFAQKKNIIEKSEHQVKMFNAQQHFYAGDYLSTLNIYTDLLSETPKDPELMGRIAECYFELDRFAEAQQMAEKSKAIDEKAYENTALILGKLFHMAGNLDNAFTEYSFYKTLISGKNKTNENEINTLISQIATAKEMTATPADVSVLNMGDAINSPYDDKAPMVTADGKTLIFTSRRPGRTSALDAEGDRKYFEDIYMSQWDTLKKAWTEAELIPGVINSEGYDACTSISADGKQIYLYKNNTDDESRGGDMYVSRLSPSGKWSSPKPMGKPVNTTYWEGGACVSADGKVMYLISERPGGMGHGDIYIVKRKSGNEWEEPVSIGTDVNTAEDEGGLFIAPDGKTLFFTSKGHNSMGGYDIFKTVNENGKWSLPVNLGYPINTVNDDLCFSLSIDARTGYFCSNRKGGLGERDVYAADLTNYLVLENDMKPKVINNGPVMAILKGDVFDATAGSGVSAEVIVFDDKGGLVGSTSAGEGNGDYFITLLAGKTYRVKIEEEGYKPIDEKIEIKVSKESTTVVVKHYLLYKK